jgi:ankyrin repeat protein
MARALLEHGAAVNAADNDGRTALMGAAVNDHPEVIALLLKHKADLKLTDKGGKTALQWAESMSHQTVINQLKNAAGTDNA